MGVGLFVAWSDLGCSTAVDGCLLVPAAAGDSCAAAEARRLALTWPACCCLCYTLRKQSLILRDATCRNFYFSDLPGWASPWQVR